MKSERSKICLQQTSVSIVVFLWERGLEANLTRDAGSKAGMLRNSIMRAAAERGSLAAREPILIGPAHFTGSQRQICCSA